MSLTNISDYSVGQDKLNTLGIRLLNNAQKHPDNTALFVDGIAYTYGELMSIVNEIYLRIPKDRTYNLIGVYCNDDVYTYASIIAVHLYGAAYIPFNNKFPADRNKEQMVACGVQLILTSAAENHLKKVVDEVVWVETKNGFFNRALKQIPFDEYKRVEQPTAYIMFTSGTTGEPKGVPVSNQNLNSFFDYFIKQYDFHEKDKFLQVYELTFDVSVFSFFMPLFVGAGCYVLPNTGVKYLTMMEQINKHGITVLSMVPTVLRYIEPYLNELRFPTLRYSFFSGDALMHSLAARWNKTLPQGQIHNFYGPAETTIVCSRYVFNEEDSLKESVNDIVPLGKLFNGMKFLIADQSNGIVKKGELCISGKQLIDNYLNMTNKGKFFLYNDERYYKTGDIASVNNKGNIVFHGRTDSQVKVNGYRIELTEVENAIASIVKSRVVVLCKKGNHRAGKLTAYIESKQWKDETLKQKLYETLPEYMVPQEFIACSEFKLNINGKVDKKQFDEMK